MSKVDPKRELKELFAPPHGKFTIVDVPEMNFLMVDGHGNPNTSAEYAAAVEALYGMAYTLKFAIKKGGGPDFVVAPLEGLWWSCDMSDFTAGTKDNWDWTALLMQPECVTPELVERARTELAKKKDVPALPKLRFTPFKEGLCAQTMYFGPYADEGPTIAAMHEFIHAQGYTRSGKHHEIYLGDPRKTAPEKLKTIIRQPMVKA